MDEKTFLLLAKVFAFIAVVVTVGWLVSFVVLPAFRQDDYKPQPEVTVVLTAVITSTAGLLGGTYFKAKRAREAGAPDEKAGPDGDRDDR